MFIAFLNNIAQKCINQSDIERGQNIWLVQTYKSILCYYFFNEMFEIGIKIYDIFFLIDKNWKLAILKADCQQANHKPYFQNI